MTAISTSPEKPKDAVFDLSMRCMSAIPKIKKEIANKYFGQAPQAAKEHQMWSRSKIGRELANAAYKEFEQAMKDKFSRPDYDYFLNCSIEQQHQYFHTDLAVRIEKILEDLNLSEE